MKHEINISTQFPLQEDLLELLKTMLSLHSVYVIGNIKEKKKQNVNLFPQSINSEALITYTLLIICYKPISKHLGSFMDDLYNKMQKQCKVYPIVYTLSDIKLKLDSGHNFLNRIINQTPCMYQYDDALFKFHRLQLSYHKRIYDRIDTEWSLRMKRAGYLISLVDIIDAEDDPTANLGILHFALEQICTALLYLFWEFKPYYYSLSYLLHLCSHFTQLPQAFFPQKAFGSQRLFYILCNAHHQMRFKSKNQLSKGDSDKAIGLCQGFYYEVQGLGEKKLEQLKKIHC